MPDTLLFEFDERDDEGELLAASVAQAWVEVAARAYEAGQLSGVPLLSQDQAKSLLADHGVIPAEWTEMEEDVQADDEGEERNRLRDHLKLRSAAARFLNEPVVRYHWPTHRVRVLWDSGAEMLRPRVWSFDRLRTEREVERQAEEDEVLYQDETLTITMADAARAIAAGARRVGSEFGAVLEAETVESSVRSATGEAAGMSELTCPNCGQSHYDWLGPQDLPSLKEDEVFCRKCRHIIIESPKKDEDQETLADQLREA